MAHASHLETGLRRGLLVGLAAFQLGCPSRVDREDPAEHAGPVTREDDPRVVRDSGDLYSVEAPSAPLEAESNAAQGLGTGKPDETNGVCRLYAPKLKNPVCCTQEYGFDADAAKTTCGHDLYLGEHFRSSCGYYFMSPGKPYTWIRASYLPQATTAKQAADEHDLVFQRRGGKPDFHSEPIPGISGGYWSSDEDLHWAFLPGWSKVRRITWRDDACSEDGILELLKSIHVAKEPAEGAERLALVPKARTK
jgi:hypothetical protein